MRVFDDFAVFKYSVFRYQYLDTLSIENQTQNDDEYIDTLEYLAIYSKTKRHLKKLATHLISKEKVNRTETQLLLFFPQ